jgi:hypothetical protein
VERETTTMKRRLSQPEVDAIKLEYDRWDKFGSDSETSDELARRLGISKATLYRLRSSGWSVDGTRPPGGGDDPVVQYLMSELIAARLKIAELERRLGNGDG